MPTCLACSIGLQPGSRFCPRCGSALLAFNPNGPLPRFSPPLHPSARLEGIGGWLIFMAVSLAVTPLFVARKIVHTDLAVFHGGGIIGASVVGSFFVLKDFVTLAALLLMNWLFYTRKQAFPRAMIGYFIWVIGTHLLEALMSVSLHISLHSSAWVRLFWSPIFSAAIWVPYLLISRRVKATFVG